MIELATMTGADDSVEPYKLVELSKKYPFVEWGILVSNSAAGADRFPTLDWIKEFSWLAGQNALQTSMHICGQWIRDLVVCNSIIDYQKFPIDLLKVVDRIQLNFHGETRRFALNFPEFIHICFPNNIMIIQMDDVNDFILPMLKDTHERSFPLFDTSHGTGELRKDWASPIEPFCGYAGGLGPDNLEEQVKLILQKAGATRIWVDMETNIRSQEDKVFDLYKVEACLKIIANTIS